MEKTHAYNTTTASPLKTAYKHDFVIRYGTFRNQCKSATQDSNTREESDKENFSDKEKDPLDVQWNSIDKFSLVAFFITYSIF